MKTITEFSGFVLKDAIAKKAALLTEGKDELEAQTAINELLKLDEAKGTFYKNVVDMTSSRVDRVKRVVVAVKANETEKVPEAYFEREGHFYLIEFFPDPHARPASNSNSNYRDDRNGGGKGGRGRAPERSGSGGGRPFPNGGAGNNFERSEAPARPALPKPEGVFKPRVEGAPAPVFAKKEKISRPPRAEKPQEKRPVRGPKGAGELRLVLKGESQTMLQGSAPGEPTSTEPQSSSV